MANNNENTKDKLWLVRNWYLVAFGLAIVAFILTIAIVASTGDKTSSTEPANTSTMLFTLPIADATIAKGYNDKALQYNATLNQWEVHKAIDFSAPVGANVCAVAKGKVTDIYSNYLDGTVVVIDHGNNLKSKYASLDANVSVSVGDTVNYGQVIGSVSASAKAEAGDKAHLHFEMLENDKKIDPQAYLNISNK